MIGNVVIRTKWMDDEWAKALKKANLYVDPHPKLALRAPDDRPSNTNQTFLVKGGFQYIIAHKSASQFYWNR